LILETFVPTIYKNGLGRVTSPPFDMITKATEKELKKNPYNIVNLKDCRIRKRQENYSINGWKKVFSVKITVRGS